MAVGSLGRRTGEQEQPSWLVMQGRSPFGDTSGIAGRSDHSCLAWAMTCSRKQKAASVRSSNSPI